MFIGLRFSFERTSITEINVEQQSTLAKNYYHIYTFNPFGIQVLVHTLWSNDFYVFFIVFLPSSSLSPLVLLLRYSNYFTFFMSICLWYNQRTYELPITGQAFLFWIQAEWNIQDIGISLQIRCHIQAKQRQQ